MSDSMFQKFPYKRLVSDLQFWKVQFKFLADACHEHQKVLEKAIDNTNQYLVTIKRMEKGEYVDKLLSEDEDKGDFGDVVHGPPHKRKKKGSHVTGVNQETGCQDAAEDTERNKQIVKRDNSAKGSTSGAKGHGEERRFFKEMKLYQGTLHTQMENLRHDALLYHKLQQDLKSYSDDPSLRISKLDSVYKVARDKFATQAMAVDDHKQAYHRTMFGMEKAEINGMLAINGDAVQDKRGRLEQLEVKAIKQANNYDKQLDKCHMKLDKLQGISTEYETTYLTREAARAEKVLSALSSGVQMRSAEPNSKRRPDFTAVNGKAIILERVIKQERIIVPCFEEYIPQEDTVDMYARARAEVEPEVGPEAEPEVGDQSHVNIWELTEDQDATKDSIAETMAANRKLKMLRNTRLHLVTKDYEKQSVNQISLKVGEYVKQLLPDNEDGLAFGEVVHGLLHKKKRGFYPSSHVTLVGNEGESHDNATDAESPKQDSSQDASITRQSADTVDTHEQTRDDLTKPVEQRRKKRRPAKATNGDDMCSNEEYRGAFGRNSDTMKGRANMFMKRTREAIARKFRGKQKYHKEQFVLVESDSEEDVTSEPEHVSTAVQADVSDSDSDDDYLVQPIQNGLNQNVSARKTRSRKERQQMKQTMDKQSPLAELPVSDNGVEPGLLRLDWILLFICMIYFFT